MQLSPILAKNAEKEQEMMAVYDNMFYDLVQMWFPAYEQLPTGVQVEVVGIVDDAMPQNRQAKIAEIIQLVTAQLISAEYARVELSKLGYEFPADMGQTVVAEQTALASAQYPDPYADRLRQEILDGGAPA
jgi:hypothetical protein